MTDQIPWLARTTEEAIEPDLLICDPHHHLWDLPESRYLVDELLKDIGGGHRVTTTVFVECVQMYRTDGPDEMRPVGETEFMERITGASESRAGNVRVAAGIVGFAELTLGPAVQQVIEAHMKESSRIRGLRYASAWDASEQIRNAHTKPPKDLLQNRAFRAGFACLGKLGLSFDAWLYHPQIPELADLARAFPDITIVLDHIGGPLGIGPYAGKREDVFALWRKNITELAQCANVVVKLGGLTMTMSGFGWHKRDAPPGSIELAEAMAPYYQTCIDCFGVERCMFESNFPVDRASCAYTIQWNAFKRLTQGYSQAERSALFHDTATRVYRLDG
ncbi:MAG: amidohydrolase family protein [Proteobacteria bacterium]|nr:amidohydrolase family protein [Pseudomonadota bacterium]